LRNGAHHDGHMAFPCGKSDNSFVAPTPTETKVLHMADSSKRKNVPRGPSPAPAPGVDISEESVAGEEDPGAALDDDGSPSQNDPALQPVPDPRKSGA
jgi:hypothetical protein